LLLRESDPLTEIESEPNDSVLMLGTMPGRRPMKPMKFRLIDGRSTSSVPEMLPPTSFVVTSTSGDSAETLTDSSIAPTASCRSSVVVLPISRRMPLSASFLNPDSSAVTSYNPGTMPPTK
jgi:hypothetical protein